MRTFNIHKPTHKFFAPSGTPAIAIGQMRGDSLVINRIEGGKVSKKSWAIGSCADALTGYGQGVAADDAASVERMQGAWRFTFGADVPPPAFCESHNAKES